MQSQSQSLSQESTQEQQPAQYQTPPFSSIYAPIYDSVQVAQTQETPPVRTPAIPYNYMPRPAYITTPGDLPAYNSYNALFDYNEANYKKQVNDKLLDKRVLDFSNPITPGTFSPSIAKSSLL